MSLTIKPGTLFYCVDVFAMYSDLTFTHVRTAPARSLLFVVDIVVNEKRGRDRIVWVIVTEAGGDKITISCSSLERLAYASQQYRWIKVVALLDDE